MTTVKTWNEFRDTGLLLFINTLLHIFGWSIILEVNKDTVINAYPARVKFRGFTEDSMLLAYKKITEYMAKESENLMEEISDEE